jgi:hypothetical protein
VLAAGTALVLATGGLAAAAVSTTDTETSLRITGDNAADQVLVTCDSGGLVTVGGASTLAKCAELLSLDVDLGEGSDRTDFTSVAFPKLAYATFDSVDSSADDIGGTPSDDHFTADALDTVRAGDGQDIITGGLVVDGGNGNDRYVNHAPGGSIVDANGTTDTVEYDWTGDADSVVSYVVSDSAVTSTINGTTATTTVSQSATTSVPKAIEQYVFTMPDGSDAADRSSIDARGTSVRTLARMFAGNDTFLGGSGDDVVDAGRGNDVIDPGAGADTVNAGDGDDQINVRDGAVDIVDCGTGTDTVIADRNDVLTGCENVDLPPLPAPTPPPAPETSKILGTKSLTRGGVATFLFVGTTGARFQCKLDQGGWKNCAAPYKVRTNKLKVGAHKLQVRAVLDGSNVDPSSSRYTFRVTKPKPKKRHHR